MKTKKSTKNAAKKAPGKGAKKAPAKKSVVQASAPEVDADLPFFIPDELKHLTWDDDLKAAWGELHESHRAFFIEWVSCLFNGAKAWRNTLGRYHKRRADKHFACVMGDQLLSRPSLMTLRAAIGSWLQIPVEELYRVTREAMGACLVIDGVETELPDHMVRLRAGAFYRKFLVDPPVKKHEHKVVDEFSAPSDMGPLEGILNKKAKVK